MQQNLHYLTYKFKLIMKQKLLKSFLLLCAFIVGSIAWADTEVTFTLNDPDAITALGITLPAAGEGTKVESIQKDGVTIAATTAAGKTDTRIFQGSGGNTGKYDFRIYQNGTLTFSAGTQHVKKIVFTGNNIARLAGNGFSTDTWTGSKASVTLTANGTVTIYTIKVTFGDPVENKVVNPEISGETSFLTSTEVTITSETEGATILYCTSGDGTNFTGYQSYTGPFTLNSTATVKAKALKSGMDNSEEVTKTFTKVTATPNVRDITTVGTSDQYVVLNNALVTYKNGNYTYLEDEIGAMLLYCTNDLAAGDMLNGYMHVTNFTTYNGLPEVKAFTLIDCEITHGNTVTPKEMTLEQLTNNDDANPYSLYYSQYVKIVDATVTSAFAGKNCTIEQGGYSIILRDQNSTATLTSTKDDVITVTGHVAIFNDTKQIAVFEQSQLVVKEAPAIPTIAEVRAEATASTVTTQGIVTSCSVGPKYATAFIQDASAAICVYAPVESATDLVVGNKVNVTGKLALQKNLLRIDEPTITLVSSGNTVTPEVITIPEIHADWEGNSLAANKQGQLVKIEKATVTFKNVFANNTSNAEIQQGEKVIMVIGIPEGIEYEVGDEMTVVGNISNNGTLCIDNPTNVEINKYVPDYAELPFEYDGDGKGTLPAGLTQEGLGTKTYASSPKMGFDTTGDILILKINEAPGTLAFDIKGNSFSGGTFKVQTSADGKEYTDLETYTELASTQTELFTLTSDVRYIKWVYTTKDKGNVALGNIKVVDWANETATISEAGYATYVTKHNVSFPADVEAFIATEVNTKLGYIATTKVTAVPKGSPILLKGKADTYTLIPAAESELSDVTGNLLKISDGTVQGGSTIYILAKPADGKVAFYPTKEGTKVKEGKAYLEVPGSAGVKAFYFDGDAETAINEVNGQSSMINGQSIYNLAGQRINKLQKGINIVNGKKVLF